MSKDAIIIALGFVVAAMPFLGFPASWEMMILVVAGLIIAVLGFLLRQEMVRSGRRLYSADTDMYTESNTDVHVSSQEQSGDNEHVNNQAS